MDFLYVLIIISAAVFVLFSIPAQIRLNKHTDTQVNFLIAAKAYNFSPFKTMAKRTMKYFLLSVALLFILTGSATAIFAVLDDTFSYLTLAACVYGISVAVYALNSALILLCAMVYVKHKLRYTAVI